VTGGEENESKHRVVDEAGLVVALRVLGFALSAVEEQLDEYYDSPDGHLRDEDVVCRLRLRGDGVVAAFKGPRRMRADGSHARIEVELPVPAGEARAALARQGLVLTWRLAKRRRIYRHPQFAVDVCLDDLPGLGSFVELEGPPPEITGLRQRLGRTIGAAEPLNYHELALAWLASAGAADDHLLFEDGQ
jgi:adenylate cyclase class 2